MCYMNHVPQLVPIMNTGKHGDPIHLEKLKDSFNVLDKILAGQTWTAGNSITIADYAIVVSVASVEVRSLKSS
ncbi:Glutathione S-transferase D2 [Blattella germanica]|nr:Glutathione S-transferase D2 [Blattella germanica]